MGEMIRYTCGECGYETTLSLGSGLAGIWEQGVRTAFAPQLLAAFDDAKANGALERFYMENERMLCPACRALLAIPVLHYVVRGDEKTLIGPCPACGGAPVPNGGTVCPKCGGALAAERTGFWD